MIHKRTKRIEFLDDIKYAKTIIIDVGLDRYKEYELTMNELGLKANNNKINFAIKEIKEQLKKLHQDYIEDKIEDDEIKNKYSEYIKPYFGKSRIPQSESIKKLREEHKLKKKKK